MRGFTKGYLTTMYIIDLILGIVFCVTVAGIIFGIPFIIASNKFKAAKDMTDEELVKVRANIFGWGIFNAIVFAGTFIGLIIVLLCAILTNNHIKSLEKGEYQAANKSFGQAIKDGATNVVQGTKDVFGIKSKTEKLQEDVAELKTLLDAGIITEEEFNTKRSELVSKL